MFVAFCCTLTDILAARQSVVPAVSGAVGEGPDLKAIVVNDGDGGDHGGDEAINEDCRLSIPDPRR